MKLHQLAIILLVIATAITLFLIRPDGNEVGSPGDHSKSRIESTHRTEKASSASEIPTRRPPISSQITISEGERRAKEKTEQMREAGVLRKKNAPNYLFIGQDGKVSRQAMIETGINAKTAEELQVVIDRHWRRMSDSLSERATLDEANSNPEQGIYLYEIQALPGGGSDEVKEFESDVIGIAGKGPGNELISAFDPSSYLGGFGKYDIRMTIKRTDDGLIVSDFQFTHPKSGIVARRGSLTKDYSYQYLGAMLDSPKFVSLGKPSKDGSIDPP